MKEFILKMFWIFGGWNIRSQMLFSGNPPKFLQDKIDLKVKEIEDELSNKQINHY